MGGMPKAMSRQRLLPLLAERKNKLLNRSSFANCSPPRLLVRSLTLSGRRARSNTLVFFAIRTSFRALFLAATT